MVQKMFRLKISKVKITYIAIGLIGMVIAVMLVWVSIWLWDDEAEILQHVDSSLKSILDTESLNTQQKESPTTPETSKTVDAYNQPNVASIESGKKSIETGVSSVVSKQWKANERVSPNLARSAAESFLRAELERTSSNADSDINLSEFQISSTELIKGDDDRTLAYVHVLNPSGFIITSGYTGIHPVVGFSFKDHFFFEDSSDNVLLHLLRWDMETRLEALNSQMDEKKIQGNILEWERIGTE